MKSLFFVLPALLLGLTACGAPVAAVTLPDTVQVEKDPDRRDRRPLRGCRRA